MQNKMTKQEKSWVMYDWANSVYSVIMMAVVFPVYFTETVNAVKNDQSGDFWWSIGTTIAMVIAAVCAPFIGALADYKGYKRKLFIAFLALGLCFTLFSAVVNNWPLMLLGYILSNVGFTGSCLVYDSFLTDVTTTDRMDIISGYGYAFGYIGGSTIPFLFFIMLMQFGPHFNINNIMAVKISLVVTVIWWFGFSIPFLKNIKQKHYIEKPKHNILINTIKAVRQTASKIFQNKTIFYFMLAYFFYIDGVGTVIHMSTSYGTTLGLDALKMILALLVTQLVAFPCAIIFSRLSKRFGSLKMLTVAVCVYLGICCIGFIMGFGLEENMFSVNTAQLLFWILAFLVGTVQGGIQAISRSHFGKLIPPENSGEFFGFYDIFGKFAAVLGPALYALTKSITGRSSFSILSLVVLFLAALFIMGTQRSKMRV